uniref:Docking protein 2 n=1 Tax=Poecilia reticulata TaxID=8081 RepID=A0A3P9N3X7_POERE
MEEDIRKQGMLFLQQQRFGKKWKRVWCVLYRESSCSISRMEFFECKDGGNVEKNDKTLRKQQESKKVIRLADCIRVSEVEVDGGPRDTGAFLVETTEKIFVFAADRNQLDDWTHRLCEVAFPVGTPGSDRPDQPAAEAAQPFPPTAAQSFRKSLSVRRTDASDRCRLKGDGVLRADMDALHLMDKTGDILYTWPYRYLRRFGRDKVSTFSFEAGRRCDSGEGSFEFDTKQGNLLFQAVEAAINLQKISLPHRQTSGGGPMPAETGPNHHNLTLPAPPANPALGHSRTPPPQKQPRVQARLEPPVDKMLTGVKSLTLDTRGLPVPRKSQVKMISSCPLPNQTYSQISMADVTVRATKKDKKGGGAAATGRDADYSLPFDTLASNIMSDILAADQGGPGADPLYDSIDELKIRNIFRSEARTTDGTYRKVDHIYDEPEGCAAATGPPAAPHPSVYDDPEEMRGDAWRIMGTSVDPKGHEYPYNPRVDDYAVPRRPKRAFASQKSVASEEEEEQKQEEPQEEDVEGDEQEELEEKQFSPYDNLVVKMA